MRRHPGTPALMFDSRYSAVGPTRASVITEPETRTKHIPAIAQQRFQYPAALRLDLAGRIPPVRLALSSSGVTSRLSWLHSFLQQFRFGLPAGPRHPLCLIEMTLPAIARCGADGVVIRKSLGYSSHLVVLHHLISHLTGQGVLG
jgi:hypothetical protein